MTAIARKVLFRTACTFTRWVFWKAVLDRVLVALTVLFILLVFQETIERTHIIDAFAYALAELINRIKIGRLQL